MIACMQRPPFPAGTEVPVVLSGISFPFGRLFRASGQITHVLRTRAPLYSPLRAFSLDLHVLGTPPAFVLSQDQTLQLRDFDPSQLPLSRRTGMVLRFYCKLEGMRGPHSILRLAIQLSKTELHRSNRAALIRTLATAGSRGRPCWFKSGRRMYFQRTLLSRGRFTENSAALPTEGPGYLHRAFFPVKLARFALARRPASRGAASIPTPGSPSRVRSGCPFRLLARGALCSPSEESRQEVPQLRCFSCRQPLSTGALCSRDPIRCQVGVAERHEPMAAIPRRHCAAALSACGSGHPASRARAARTISSRRASASSISSLSSTYS